MRMMLVGAGAVGESILKVMKWRDPNGTWLEYVLVCDFEQKRAQEVVDKLDGDDRFEAGAVNATEKEAMMRMIRIHQIDFLMDAAPPFASNYIFDAAYETGIDYGNMGTWSVPMDHPAYGIGIENSYTEPMTKYNFDRFDFWKKRGNMAVICMGIDPGVVNVFAKYAATQLLDEIYEVHVKDGGNLSVPGADPDDIMFGFNVWTVLDEVMNPNVEYDASRGGFLVERPFAGKEIWEMPDGVGKNTLVKVEHEEVVTMPRYLKQYGLQRATFKISLDENLITALKVIDKLGLRSIHPVRIGETQVIPRDVVAACAPQPKDIGSEMTGEMLVGVQCIGKKDGEDRSYFLYQAFDNQESMKRWGSQAVVAQTGFGAALAIELIGKGIWKDAGVYSPEYFDPLPYMKLMNESGYEYRIEEMKL
ncbi:saccharopine dehydrogenase family protein [Faecalicatena contorta]|uniref:saccharopine dehydrogenase family protein n=1 Tax=Faecalicatena contorta TaxID=39482 RepID=UPI001F255C27|nr:saccharopine dehydrogenase C-terminal domain-containing protein [Faecalicatena contorta]